MFFDTKRDLLDILVPYFVTGLTQNEYCFWVLAEPLTEDEARQALERGPAWLNRGGFTGWTNCDSRCWLGGGQHR